MWTNRPARREFLILFELRHVQTQMRFLMSRLLGEGLLWPFLSLAATAAGAFRASAERRCIAAPFATVCCSAIRLKSAKWSMCFSLGMSSLVYDVPT